MLTKFNACCPQTVLYYPYLGASEEFEVKIGLRQGSTEPHQQEDGGEGYHEETPLCRRPGRGGEWQTANMRYRRPVGVERAVYQRRTEN